MQEYEAHCQTGFPSQGLSLQLGKLPALGLSCCPHLPVTLAGLVSPEQTQILVLRVWGSMSDPARAAEHRVSLLRTTISSQCLLPLRPMQRWKSHGDLDGEMLASGKWFFGTSQMLPLSSILSTEVPGYTGQQGGPFSLPQHSREADGRTFASSLLVPRGRSTPCRAFGKIPSKPSIWQSSDPHLTCWQ